jgi:hypothetical protein
MHRTIAMLLVLGAATVASAAGPAKPFPRDDKGIVRFQEVVPVEGATVAELHTRAKLWAARAFKSAKDAIQLDDAQAGRLILRGSHQDVFGGVTPVWYLFTLTVESKEGRYRWTLDQVECSPGPGRSWPIEKELTKQGVGIFTKTAIHERFRLAVVALGADLAAAMKTPDSNDEW